MYLRRITLVNWANVPNDTYELAQVVLMTGPSGAGKTTILDAIQTLMAGALPEIMRYNLSQEEGGTRSREKKIRTLASYVLGADEDLFSRPNGAHCYLIGEFEPNTGESGEPFCALIGVTAPPVEQQGGERVARHEEPLCLLVRNARLGMEDVTRTRTAGGREAVPVAELVRHLKVSRPELDMELARTRTDYLALLYGALSGKRSALNIERAKKAARQLVRFMAYKKLDTGLDAFVREEILEPVDLSKQIEEVSQAMRDIQAMEEQARQISEAIGNLAQAERLTKTVLEVLCENELREYENAQRDHHRGRKDLVAAEQALEATKEALAEHQRELDRLTREQSRLTERHSELVKQAEGHDAVRRKRELEKNLAREAERRTRAVQQLLEQNRLRAENNRRLRELAAGLKNPRHWRPQGQDWQSLIEAALNDDSWEAFNLARVIEQGSFSALLDQERAAQTIEARYNRVLDALREQEEAIDDELASARSESKEIEKTIRELDEDIARLRSGARVLYPGHVEAAITLIRQELPQADPKVLCDYIEVTDERWQRAIEGFFGMSRFTIFVRPEYEAQAIRLVRQHRREIGRARIAQGAKAQRDLERNPNAVAPDSIVHLMRFSNPIVERIVKAKYGPVRQVMSSEELRFVGRGLMMDGQSSGGYQMEVKLASESDLAFGQRARERALASKERERDVLKEELVRKEQAMRERYAFAQAARNLHRLDLVNALDTVNYAQVEIESIESQLQALSVTEHETLLAEIEAYAREIEACTKRLQALNQDIGSARTTRGNLETHIDQLKEKLARQAGRLERATARVRQFETLWDEYPWGRVQAQIEQALDDETPAMRTRSDQKARAMLNGAVMAFNLKRMRTFQIALPQVNDLEENDPLEDFQDYLDVLKQVRQVLSLLRDDLLVQNAKSLENARKRFNEAFLTDYCLSMNNLIRAGQDTLERLNKHLERQVFGEEYFQFTMEWNKEFEEYAQFFRRMAEHAPSAEQGNSLFESGQLSEKDRQIYERIKALLLSEDVEKSQRELLRLSDYRRYRHYDILKHYTSGDHKPISLRRYGTGSGGQTETPSYVTRTAALGAALGWLEGDTHLRFVMIDESFTQLDEQRAGDVIRFLTETMGLQMLFVVPNKSAAPLYNKVDMVIQVTKIPSERPRGELKTRVVVDRKILRRERIDELWQRERTQAEQRAHQLAFLNLLDAEEETAHG